MSSNQDTLKAAAASVTNINTAEVAFVGIPINTAGLEKLMSSLVAKAQQETNPLVVAKSILAMNDESHAGGSDA